MEEALKQQEKELEDEDLAAREALILDPNSLYSDKFEAVMLDLLSGNHPSQASSSDSDLHKGPTDHGEDDENPTSDY